MITAEDTTDKRRQSLFAEPQTVSNLPHRSPHQTPSAPSRPESQLKANAPETSPLIYGAVYSGVTVYEMMCRNIAVMRRKDDSYLNATQILKVAGIDKGKRTKILEKEILPGIHEKVQGGYGKYQGTWIPYKRGVELAKQYQVDHLLRPLLDFDVAPLDTPSKEDYLAAQKKAAAAGEYVRPGDSSDQAKRTYNRKHLASSHKQQQKLPEFHVPPDHGMHDQTHLHKKLRIHGDIDDPNPLLMLPYSQQLAMVKEPMSTETNKSVLMSIFMSDDPNFLPDALVFSAPGEINLDMVIDEQGNTSIHWAAALARVSTLRFLINKGANIAAKNHNGETALIRSVQVTNNYDAHCFEELLGALFSTIHVSDHKNQTALHHIATCSGLKHRGQASRYYMECILAKIAAEGPSFGSFVDRQDINGDSPLTLAGRVGHQNIVEQLMDVGANPELQNNAGLRLADFGYEYLGLKPSSPPPMDTQKYNDLLALPNIQPQIEKVHRSLTNEHVRHEVSQEIQKMISDMNTAYSVQVHKHQEQLLNTQRQLRELTRELCNLRKQNIILRQENQQLPDLLHRAQVLEKCLCDELSRKQLESSLYEQNYMHSIAMRDQYSSPDDMRREIAHLRSQLTTKDQIGRELKEEVVHLKANKSTTEHHCRRIISQCCNIPLEDVDNLLSPLMHAVENDDSLADISEVAGFMSRVKQQDLIGKT